MLYPKFYYRTIIFNDMILFSENKFILFADDTNIISDK